MDIQDKLYQNARDFQQRSHERQLAEEAALRQNLQHQQTIQVEEQKLFRQVELNATIQAMKEEQRKQAEEQAKVNKRHFCINTLLTVLSVCAAVVAAIASIIALCR